ncbi:binding-protein-dependent transport systems inner membrane component [Ancylobacter novellus DSM 506]|uniref:Binding-protein-dependent transport systems inner membrane component n=1 Tax=Ancylobacter novellus (strain ATCC 8093 / DSM 506 / JCM 20403 / CCM 1077 / IAM 12100 / NBRC 12443 / NCIMB 10456) TaxID=639283 RepID=D7A2Q6_ANCN5|nr:sugar ABC transporter permease [Ancylobacter novellus]ADH91586.1 binding-protein-dependent transport systems inner membrane component [Ancylobacter novellus DSM 506]
MTNLSVSKWRRPDFTTVAFVSVAGLFLAVMIVPVTWAIILGFTNSGPFSARLTYAGLSNFVDTFADEAFWRALLIGTIYAVVCTVLEVVLGVAIAILIFRYGHAAATTFVLMPYMIPTVTTALVWRWMTDSLNGIFNVMLMKWGLVGAPIEFTSSGALAMSLVVVASVWQFTPFVVLVILANLGTISSSIYEAGKVDGTNWWQELIYITLPIIRASILLVILLRGIWMFNRFDVIWLLTSGGPLGSTTTLPLYAYVQAFGNNDYGLAGAASTIIFMILLVFGIIYIRVFQPEKEVARG